MQLTFEILTRRILQWARARRIIQNASATSQLLKAVSELGELADAHNKNDKAGIIDGVGDTVVCLINYCEIQDLDLVECLASAYMQIKDRKGTLLPSGVFVKEGDQ